MLSISPDQRPKCRKLTQSKAPSPTLRAERQLIRHSHRSLRLSRLVSTPTLIIWTPTRTAQPQSTEQRRLRLSKTSSQTSFTWAKTCRPSKRRHTRQRPSVLGRSSTPLWRVSKVRLSAKAKLRASCVGRRTARSSSATSTLAKKSRSRLAKVMPTQTSLRRTLVLSGRTAKFR